MFFKSILGSFDPVMNNERRPPDNRVAENCKKCIYNNYTKGMDFNFKLVFDVMVCYFKKERVFDLRTR